MTTKSDDGMKGDLFALMAPMFQQHLDMLSACVQREIQTEFKQFKEDLMRLGAFEAYNAQKKELPLGWSDTHMVTPRTAPFEACNAQKKEPPPGWSHTLMVTPRTAPKISQGSSLIPVAQDEPEVSCGTPRSVTSDLERDGQLSLFATTQAHEYYDHSLRTKNIKEAVEIALGRINHEQRSIFDSRSNKFNTMMGVFVLLNTVNLTIQVDFQSPQRSGRVAESLLAGTDVAENFFVFVFTVELCMRFYCEGHFRALLMPWTALDFVLLVMSYVSIWHEIMGTGGGELAFVSMFRMVRLLRLIKLTRAVEELHVIVVAFLNSMTRCIYVFLLLAAIIWCGAILCTEGIGNSKVQFPPYIKEERFATIPSSFFSLFQVMTLDSWCSGLAWPVVLQKPWYAVFFVLFVSSTAFGVVNILVAVVVDSMGGAMSHTQVTVAQEESVRIESTLIQIFEAADLDKSGTLSMSELGLLLADEGVYSYLSEIMKNNGNIPPTRKGLQVFFSSGGLPENLGKEEFVDSIMRCCFFNTCDSSSLHARVCKIDCLVEAIAERLNALISDSAGQ